MALKSDGTVWGWGDNTGGQLGDDSQVSRPNPAKVSGFTDVVAISGEGYYTLALKSDGTVWSWGTNSGGSLGDGSVTNKLIPVQVSGLTGVIAVDATSFSIALKSDGTVWTWGKNTYGQLGEFRVSIFALACPDLSRLVPNVVEEAKLRERSRGIRIPDLECPIILHDVEDDDGGNGFSSSRFN
jgi:alpha-tubulin suppressor-like RCC1 family protein